MTATALDQRLAADNRKRTCSNCLRGNHGACTTATCAHFECIAEPRDDGTPPRTDEHDPADAELVWEDPPRGRQKDPALTPGQERSLRSRPGAWARVKTFKSKTAASTFAGSLRAGKRPSPAGSWEWSAARHNDGSALYARFVEED